MKRLLFSDLHLHTWAYGSTVTDLGYNSRLWGQAQALTQIVDYVKEHNIEHAYFLGDLFHTHGRVPTQALVIATRFFNALRSEGVKIRGMYGNHDMEDKSGSINAVSAILTPQETAGSWIDNERKVVALPYTEDEDTLKRFLDNVPDESMILLHQGVAGVPLSSGYVLDEKLSPGMIPDTCVAFTGHYHFHKKVSDRLTVVGNLTPLNWSDIDQNKGFVVYDDETGEMEQVLQQGAPKFTSWNEGFQEDIEGGFIRWTDEVKQSDQEEIRKSLIEQGALTVEFPKVKLEEGASAIRTGEEVTVEHLVKSFETEEMEPRRVEVGLEIREERYEAAQA